MRSITKRYKSKQATSCKVIVLAAAIAACLPAYSMEAPQETQAESTVTFSIPSGSLTAALDTFSAQSGKQLLYRQELVAGKKSPTVSGALTPTEALDAILRGSGLIWERVNNTTIVIKSTPARPASTPPKAATTRPSQASSSPGEQEIKALAEVLVVGSRSLNADVARSRNDIQPYVVFEREDISSSMASNVEEFLSARLPMNQTAGPSARSVPPSVDVGNRSRLNLRGMGVNQTLILINGRRAPGVSRVNVSGDLDQPDINGIPLAAIERIEVLPATASGIYGGSATGGVINVILRSDYEGSSIRLSYDNTFDTDSARMALDLATTFTLEGGKTRVAITASRSQANPLLEADRGFAERARALALANAPELVYAYANPRPSSLTNISSLDGKNLTLLDGTDVGSRITHVPAGYAGWKGDGGRGLVANAGRYDMSLPNTTFGRLHGLGQTPTTTAAYLTIKRDFNDSFSTYLDLSATKNESLAQTGTTAGGVLYPGDPGNPFKNLISVNYPVGTNEVPRYVASNTYGINGGLIYRLSEKWSMGLDLRWNRSTNENDYKSFFYDPFLMGPAARSGALDVFKDLNVSPPNLDAYKSKGRYVFGPAPAFNNEVAARVSGRYWRLPGGDATLTALLSRRRESTGEVMFDLGGFGTYQYFPSRSQTVDSFYAETAVPVIGEMQAIPFIEQFDLQVSVRRDSYTTVGVPPSQSLLLTDPNGPIPPYTPGRNTFGSTDYTVGFRYKPHADVALRASYGTGFLPPSVAQVAASETITRLTVFDPKRGGGSQLYNPVSVTYAGGTAELEPERSKSLSVGAIYQPTDLGLRVSLDYTRIRKMGEISGITPQTMINLEDRFPGRIERGAPLPGDPVGWAGVITKIDASLLNIAETRVDALDVQVDADWDLGRYGWLRAWSVFSRQTSLARRILPDTPLVDRVGYVDGPLDWRGSAGVEWTLENLKVQLSAQHFDAYKVYASDSNASTIDFMTSLQGSTHIPSQTYFDASFNYRLSGGLLQDSRITLGVKNLFDRSPPIIADVSARGGYSTYGDPRMRSYFLAFEKQF